MRNGSHTLTTVSLLLLGLFTASLTFAHTQTHKTEPEHSHHDSCWDSLAASKRLADLGERVRRLQTKIAKGLNTEAYLEKLAWTLIQLARSKSDESLYAQAERVSDCLLNANQDSLSGKLIRGHLRHQQHRFSAAEILARELVAKRGYWFDHALLGDVLAEQGATDEAATHYQAMVDQRPGPSAYSRVANIRWLTGDLKGALDAMDLAVSAAVSNENRAWALVKYAEYLFHDGRLEAAEKLCQAAIKMQKNFAQGHAFLGRIKLAQNEVDGAINHLRVALDISALPQTQWWLYESYLANQELAKAKALVPAIQANPEDPRTISLFLTTTGLNPEYATQLAVDELTNRRDALTWDALAWARHTAGDSQEAAEAMDTALAQGLKHARIYLHGGIIENARGNHDLARTLLEKANQSRHVLLPTEQDLLEKNLNPFFVSL